MIGMIKMDNKIIITLSLIIALLVGYIVGNGGSKSYADVAGGDVAVLTEILKKCYKRT